MTVQQAHEHLHERLPAGSTVTISQNLWTRSTVASGPAVQATTSGDWHVVATVPDEVDRVDHVEGAFGSDLASVVEQVLAQLALSGKLPRPPRIAAPSQYPSHAERQRDAS